jgi:hypothetical protein
MDIPFLILAIAAGLLLSRRRALIAVTTLWAIAVTMVGWGPANSDGVHTDSIGFWGPWLIALAIGLGLATVMTVLRERRRTQSAPRS